MWTWGGGIKESEKIHQYLDPTREQKTLEHAGDDNNIWSWGFGMIPKDLGRGLEQLEIRGRIETILTAALLRSARILRRAMEQKTIFKRWYEKIASV